MCPGSRLCVLPSTVLPTPGQAQPDSSSGLCSLRAGKRGGQEGGFEQLQHLLSRRDLELVASHWGRLGTASAVSHQCWQDPLVFRSWQGCHTGHPPGSSHPCAIQDCPCSTAGTCHSGYIPPAGSRQVSEPVTASAFGFLNCFLPGRCGEKVTWRGRTQPECCRDPRQEATALQGLPGSSSGKQPASPCSPA